VLGLGAMVLWLIFGTLAVSGAAFAATPLFLDRKARAAALLVVVAVAGAGLALYASLGRPELAARAFQPPENQDLAALVANLAVRVHREPDKLRGWLLLGRGYFALGAKEDAARALAQAARLAKAQRVPPAQRAAILSDYAVALSQAAGAVTPEAESALKESVALDAKGSAARYYLGIAAAERGDAATAERLWQELLADAPADAPYRGEIVDRLAALKADAAARGGNAPDIRAMVDDLAARLAARPNDLEGWRRLVRAYAVLGERDKAEAALRTARAQFVADAPAMAALAQAARENALER
jgi:cytochrome c-type biogenesis protein CcmH